MCERSLPGAHWRRSSRGYGVDRECGGRVVSVVHPAPTSSPSSAKCLRYEAAAISVGGDYETAGSFCAARCIPSSRFGQAQFDGPVAIVSLCRLHQEFYGLPAQKKLLRERTVKETLHELGHTFGLVHCSDSKCAMSLATHIELVDSKSEKYCARCGDQLVQRFARNGGS